MAKSILVGKFLNWEHEDGEYYSTHQFIADLGNGFFLMERIGMQSEEPLAQYQVVDLGQLAVSRDSHVIYNTWEDRENWADEDKSNKILKLVRKDGEET